MSILHRPELHVGAEGTVIDTFDAYDVTLDCFQPGNPFTFSLWRSADRRSTWQVIQRECKVGAAVLFRMDGALLVNGFLQTVSTSVDRENGALTLVQGRDIGARALAWDASPACSFKGLTLEDGLTRLYADLDIPLIVGALAEDARSMQTGALLSSARVATRRHRRHHRIDRSHPKAGEKVWGYSESMVRRAGLFQWIAPVEERGTMALVLNRYDYKSPPSYRFERRLVPLTDRFAGNIVRSEETISTADVPTFVRVYGHCARGDKFSFRYAPGVTNDHLLNEAITRGKVVIPHPKQPRYIKSQRARTYEEANQEGDRLIAKTMMGFRRMSVTVQGHSQPSGPSGAQRLYAINTVATVIDEVLGIHEDMMIHKVQFRGRRQGGTETTLTLVPLSAVQLSVGITEEDSSA